MGKGGKREGEKHQYKRETSISCLLHVPQPGTKPITKACALTENQSHHLSGYGMMPNQLSPTSQGPTYIHFSGNVSFLCITAGSSWCELWLRLKLVKLKVVFVACSLLQRFSACSFLYAIFYCFKYFTHRHGHSILCT